MLPRSGRALLPPPGGPSPLRPAVGSSDEEAGHRPDGLVIEGCEDAGSAERRVVGPRLDGAPTDRNVFSIGEEAGDRSGVHDLPEGLLVRLALRALVLRSGEAPPHAPAAAAGPPRPEQRLEVGPSVGGQGADVQRVAHRRSPSRLGVPCASRHRRVSLERQPWRLHILAHREGKWGDDAASGDTAVTSRGPDRQNSGSDRGPEGYAGFDAHAAGDLDRPAPGTVDESDLDLRHHRSSVSALSRDALREGVARWRACRATDSTPSPCGRAPSVRPPDLRLAYRKNNSECSQ